MKQDHEFFKNAICIKSLKTDKQLLKCWSEIRITIGLEFQQYTIHIFVKNKHDEEKKSLLQLAGERGVVW